jgi:hypothetical protein
MWRFDKIGCGYEAFMSDYGRASLMQTYGDVGVKSQSNNTTLALPLEDNNYVVGINARPCISS